MRTYLIEATFTDLKGIERPFSEILQAKNRYEAVEKFKQEHNNHIIKKLWFKGNGYKWEVKLP